MSTRSLQIECLLTPVIDYRTNSVASGYSVYFYAAGTSTAKNVWTEKEKTNPYTSATLGSDGTVQLYGDGVYKIVISDTDSTPVYEWDNVKIQYPNIAVLSKSGTYTATVDDDYILVGATMTLNLYAAASFTHPICVKLTGAYTLTIDPSGAELIEGASTYTLDTEDSAVWLFSNGSAWFVANATSTSAVDSINLVASVGGAKKLTAKSATLDIETNNEYLRQLDFAGTGYVDLIKANASDHVELGGALEGLKIFDSDVSHYGTISIGSNFTANRSIGIKGGDLNFVILTGDVGTVTSFGQNSAPTGWTRLTTGDAIYDAAADNAMICFAKTGDVAQGGAASPQSTHTHTGPSHTHTTGDITLTAAQSGLPSHTHGVPHDNAGGAIPYGLVAGISTPATYGTTTEATGGSAASSAHNHGATGANGNQATGANSAPYYVEMILVKKD